MTTDLPIRVEVPVCAFRPYASREYQDTFPVPAPSSVYGMLLSLLGVPREQKERHRGAEMALAIAELPGRSKVFRKLRRGADLENTRPDYQDVLMDLTLWVWLRPGADTGNPPLSSHVPAALSPPYAVTRFGGLSLGESSYLVDVIAVDQNPPADLSFVVPEMKGFYSLPVWVDHVNRANTVLNRFRITDPAPVVDTLPRAWFRIGG
ncbi:MAG: type I-MYXAN CRISPR-associated protein Cas5/Cmx5/DevS [Planctomycetota bacterium]